MGHGDEVAAAVAAARREVAQELHDGVVQLLAHLRLELEFLARHGSEEGSLGDDLERLAATAARGLDDVRGLMDRLTQEPT